MSSHYDILVLGGGSAGISIAARLAQMSPRPRIAIVEPSTEHYYQPLWTLVGGGVLPKEHTERREADFIPDGVTWIQDRVMTFEPEKNQVTTHNGQTLSYEQLVVALGIQLDWDHIQGLPEALGRDGVCSNYAYDTVDATWRFIQNTRSGNAVFTFPNTPIKCAGAPQKIMYLAEETFRQRGVRSQVSVLYTSAVDSMFGVPKYRQVLDHIVAERDIEPRFKHNLVEIRPASREAVFQVDGAETVISYEMLHVTPPQSAPDVIKQSALANPAGWVDVHKHTLQHVRFDNVWSAGDCSSLPCSKTGAAVRKQVPVLVENLLAARAGKPLTGHYNGYASCPLVTGRGKVVLAEFGYDGEIMETFPFDQGEERYSMYALKAYALPNLYWNGMLRGRL